MMLTAGLVLCLRTPPAPVYQGRSVAAWVDEAMKGGQSSAAFVTVLEIGAPALPFIIRKGLYHPCHRLKFLSYGVVEGFRFNYPLLGRWVPQDNCVLRHYLTRELIRSLGTNAQAAIPGLIDCLEHCPNLHCVNAWDLLDTLSEINETNPAVIPYLSRRANQDDCLTLPAAALAYVINQQTNLLVETCARLARKNPAALLGTPELYGFREDHELNRHIVPLLEKLYFDTRLNNSDRESVLCELEYHGSDASAVLARLRASK
jgi:hypothetical protein